MGQARLRGKTKEERVQNIYLKHEVKPLTTERYNAYIAWTRSPAASVVGKELEFFSNLDETLIGVVILDKFDRDFGHVVLGRDEKMRFRAIDLSVSCSSKVEARNQLFNSLKKHTSTGKSTFPQGDTEGDKSGVDLFRPLVDESKLHPSFKILKDHDLWLPARSIMSEMMRHFVDVDGNFVEQFQTQGFDSRIWELYLYAALLEMGLFVERPKPAPDFQVFNGRQKVFIEAVTVGPSSKDIPLPETADDGKPRLRTSEEIRALLKTRAPIRFGSALHSKLTKENPYWELEHVKEHPLVFAIADFHERASMTWTSPALLEYLYGVTHDFQYDKNGQLIITAAKLETHEFEGKKIPSGFFLQKDSENVSAVLFSASGTSSKFNRMGRLAGFSLSNTRMFRYGTRHNHDPNASLPIGFWFAVEQGQITENWADGISVFHNPRAKHPLSPEIFPGVAHHFFEDGQIKSILPEFHIYSSMTMHFLITDEKPASDAHSTDNTNVGATLGATDIQEQNIII